MVKWWNVMLNQKCSTANERWMIFYSVTNLRFWPSSKRYKSFSVKTLCRLWLPSSIPLFGFHLKKCVLLFLNLSWPVIWVTAQRKNMEVWKYSWCFWCSATFNFAYWNFIYYTKIVIYVSSYVAIYTYSRQYVSYI